MLTASCEAFEPAYFSMPVWMARIASQSRKSIDAKTRASLLPPQQDSVDMMDGNSVGSE
jgi:hypothetical protein